MPPTAATWAQQARQQRVACSPSQPSGPCRTRDASSMHCSAVRERQAGRTPSRLRGTRSTWRSQPHVWPSLYRGGLSPWPVPSPMPSGGRRWPRAGGCCCAAHGMTSSSVPRWCWPRSPGTWPAAWQRSRDRGDDGRRHGQRAGCPQLSLVGWRLVGWRLPTHRGQVPGSLWWIGGLAVGMRSTHPVCSSDSLWGCARLTRCARPTRRGDALDSPGVLVRLAVGMRSTHPVCSSDSPWGCARLTRGHLASGTRHRPA